MSSKKRKSQKVADIENNKKIDDYFPQIDKKQENNPGIPQMKTGSRKGLKNITNTQDLGRKDQAISPNKVLYIILDVHLRKNKQRKHMLTHDAAYSLSVAIDTLQAVKEERDAQSGREILVRGVKEIEGYINLGMPLSCLPDNCHLAVTFARSKSKQKAENQISGRLDKGSTDCVKFFIHAIGKERKRLVRRGELHKEGCRLCVFAFKGETVKDAVCKDGRFLSFLESEDWRLIESLDSVVESSQLVDALEGKLFQVEVKGSRGAKTAAPPSPQPGDGNADVLGGEIVAQYPSLKRETEKIREIFKKKLKKTKERRLFLEQKTNFGKVTKNSTPVKTLKLLCHLSESVGYIEWDNNGNKGCATCFVFTGLYIFTCRHVISNVVGRGISPSGWASIIGECVRVAFGYEDSQDSKNFFPVEPWFEVSDADLDYAVLKLKENGQQVPVGLYNGIGPAPRSGLIYIIGHPDREAKATDACVIIPQEQRVEKCREHLQAEGYNDDLQFIHMFTQKSFQEIVPIPVITYDTCFYFGSSGSPVFDSKGSLVAMHAAGFHNVYQSEFSSIIELGITMESILHNIKQNYGAWYDELFKTQQDVEMMSDEGC